MLKRLFKRKARPVPVEAFHEVVFKVDVSSNGRRSILEDSHDVELVVNRGESVRRVAEHAATGTWLELVGLQDTDANFAIATEAVRWDGIGMLPQGTSTIGTRATLQALTAGIKVATSFHGWEQDIASVAAATRAAKLLTIPDWDAIKACLELVNAEQARHGGVVLPVMIPDQTSTLKPAPRQAGTAMAFHEPDILR